MSSRFRWALVRGFICAAASVLLILQVQAQNVAAFGNASPLPEEMSLRAVAPQHYGVFCLNYSGFTSGSDSINEIRAGRRDSTEITLSSNDANSISSDTWRAILLAYGQYQQTLENNGALGGDAAEARKKLLSMSLPLFGTNSDTRSDATDLIDSSDKTKADTEIDIENQNREDPKHFDRTRRALSDRSGIPLEKIDKNYLVTRKLYRGFSGIFFDALQDPSISAADASKIYGLSEYQDNVLQWGLSPTQLRGQASAELAFALFREGRFQEAREAANASLAALALSPKRYFVTNQDDMGHRRVQFSVNLAFLIARFSDYEIAKSTSDPVNGFKASLDLIQHLDDLEPMLWYFSKQWSWPKGIDTYNSMLEHFADNLSIIANPKAKVGPLSSLSDRIDASWWDDEDNTLYAVIRGDGGNGNIAVGLARNAGGGWIPPAWVSGGAGTPPPPGGPTFSGNRPPRGPRLFLVAGEPGRDKLIRYLRRQIDSNSTSDVALFTVIREGDKFRVILPTNRLRSLPDSAKGRLEKYDTFLINENELAGSSNLSTDSPRTLQKG